MEGAAHRIDRACGALLGVALGDALGMPSQTLTPAEIQHHYGEITDFVAPIEDHPVSHGLGRGQVTDDTEQTLRLAHRLIAGQGVLDEAAWAQDLLDWEASVRARGLRDLLGPSTKAAIDALGAGLSPSETGRGGTTNGAAMRIAPLGIAVPATPVANLVNRVTQACRLTHHTGEAIAGASAVASVISSGIDGTDFDAACEGAVVAAQEGQSRGHPVGEPQMAARITRALDLADRSGSARAVAEQIGTSVASRESVPTAFALVRLAQGDPWRAAIMAANIGDDTDTIGAIAGAMAGACAGRAAFPDHALETLLTANALAIDDTAAALLALRATADAPPSPVQEVTP